MIYSPLFADTAVVDRILRVGQERRHAAGLVLPAGATQRADLEAACRAADVTLHGTGIHPGGITERFPLMVSALSRAVTHVRAEEFSDIRTYGAPDVVRDWMLFGTTPEEAATSIMPTVLGAGFRQSVRMVGRRARVRARPGAPHHARDRRRDRADRLAHRRHRARARRRAALPLGGTVDGEPVITAAVNWFMGEEHLDPAWSFGPEGERFEVEITGDPPVRRHLPRAAPRHDRRGPERNPRHRRDRDALCERGALRVRRRAGDPDLSRSPADRRARRAGVAGRVTRRLRQAAGRANASRRMAVASSRATGPTTRTGRYCPPPGHV